MIIMMIIFFILIQLISNVLGIYFYKYMSGCCSYVRLFVFYSLSIVSASARGPTYPVNDHDHYVHSIFAHVSLPFSFYFFLLNYTG